MTINTDETAKLVIELCELKIKSLELTEQTKYLENSIASKNGEIAKLHLLKSNYQAKLKSEQTKA